MTTTPAQYSEHARHRRPQAIELTPEETKVWEECIKNSSVIPSTVITAGLGYGIFRISPLRAHAKYATIAGAILGLVWGKLAISSHCFMKLTSLPNSNFKARLIEAGYYGNKQTSEMLYQGYQPSSIVSKDQHSEELPTIEFDDYQSMNTFDVYSSINDSSDSPPSEDIDLTEPINLQKGIGYDELRYKNRDDFYKRNKQWYGSQTPQQSTPAMAERTQEASTSNTTAPQEKTRYGDVWG